MNLVTLSNVIMIILSSLLTLSSTDYQQYQAWPAEGNTYNPAPTVIPPLNN